MSNFISLLCLWVGVMMGLQYKPCVYFFGVGSYFDDYDTYNTMINSDEDKWSGY